MAGSLDDRVSLVLMPSDYRFVVVVGDDSKVYRSPLVHPSEIVAELRRVADIFEGLIT